MNRRLGSIVVALSLLAAMPLAAQQSNYSHRMATQLEVMKIRPEQNKSFQRILKRYYNRLENAPRRVSSAGRGDFHTMIKREVKTVGKHAVKSARKVLDEDQLKAFERYIKIAGKRYTASLGLN